MIICSEYPETGRTCAGFETVTQLNLAPMDSERLTVVCETKWDETKWKWKSVVCEMGICSLRNGNLYFAKWKSVVCEMEICSLRNENL